jgi:hypothetical protein
MDSHDTPDPFDIKRKVNLVKSSAAAATLPATGKAASCFAFAKILRWS